MLTFRGANKSTYSPIPNSEPTSPILQAGERPSVDLEMHALNTEDSINASISPNRKPKGSNILSFLKQTATTARNLANPYLQEGKKALVTVIKTAGYVGDGAWRNKGKIAGAAGATFMVADVGMLRNAFATPSDIIPKTAVAAARLNNNHPLFLHASSKPNDCLPVTEALIPWFPPYASTRHEPIGCVQDNEILGPHGKGILGSIETLPKGAANIYSEDWGDTATIYRNVSSTGIVGFPNSSKKDMTLKPAHLINLNDTDSQKLLRDPKTQVRLKQIEEKTFKDIVEGRPKNNSSRRLTPKQQSLAYFTSERYVRG